MVLVIAPGIDPVTLPDEELEVMHTFGCGKGGIDQQNLVLERTECAAPVEQGNTVVGFCAVQPVGQVWLDLVHAQEGTVQHGELVARTVRGTAST